MTLWRDRIGGRRRSADKMADFPTIPPVTSSLGYLLLHDADHEIAIAGDAASALTKGLYSFFSFFYGIVLHWHRICFSFGHEPI